MNIENIVREYVDKSLHMSLGTAKDNQPWVCEVHFAYDDNLNLYYRSLTSRRHSQEIADNPNVAGNIVKQHGLDEPGIGVYFEGAAEQLKPGEEQNEAFRCLKERLNASAAALKDAEDPNGHQFYKITVSKWYVFGPFNDQPAQKYELAWKGNQ